MNDTFDKPLFVLEMANNHMGDVKHGLHIVRSFAEVCKDYPFRFAFKMQYRHLDSLIHPDCIGRFDNKQIKRFSETRLTRDETRHLVDEIKSNDFIAMCTPFDNDSIKLVVEDGFDILKIASCSATDWPLLDGVVQYDLPMVISTAGVTLDEIDKVVTFLQNRKKNFALMHCVAEYPTPAEHLELNQIDLLRSRYPNVPVGYSTHEEPSMTLPVGLAMAKGCMLFEKHVGVPTDAYALNAYSATPKQIAAWLDAALQAVSICGRKGGRIEPTKAETDSLFSLRRGVFASRDIVAGDRIGEGDVFFAIPTQPGHFTANDWSKYTQFRATADIPKNGALTIENAKSLDVRDAILKHVSKVKALLKKGHVVVPGQAQLELSHHYGLDRFNDYGITMITVVNRQYCKKLIVVLPGQKHPEQYHNVKEETFHVLHGSLSLTLDGETSEHGPSSVVTVGRGVRHAFESVDGAIFEEISSTHSANDSFYTDPEINNKTNRKTFISYWLE